MSTPTTNFGLSKPAVNSPTDEDQWGGELNDNSDELDSLLLTAIDWTSENKTSGFPVTGRTDGTSDTGDSNKLFLCDATSGSITVSLPAAAVVGNGFIVAFKKTDASANHVILDGNGTETIDGNTTYDLTTRYAFVIVQCDGAEWNVVGSLTDVSGLAPLASPAFTGIPTAPTAASNTSTTQLATTEFVNRASTQATNGSVTEPNGLIRKWGFVTPGSSSANTVTFDVAFPNNIFNAQVTVAGVTDGKRSAGLQSISTTGLVVWTGEGSSGSEQFPFYWMAIGN